MARLKASLFIAFSTNEETDRPLERGRTSIIRELAVSPLPSLI
jgi:hypothetical protein